MEMWRDCNYALTALMHTTNTSIKTSRNFSCAKGECNIFFALATSDTAFRIFNKVDNYVITAGSLLAGADFCI